MHGWVYPIYARSSTCMRPCAKQNQQTEKLAAPTAPRSRLALLHSCTELTAAQEHRQAAPWPRQLSVNSSCRRNLLLAAQSTDQLHPLTTPAVGQQQMQKKPAGRNKHGAHQKSACCCCDQNGCTPSLCLRPLHTKSLPAAKLQIAFLKHRATQSSKPTLIQATLSAGANLTRCKCPHNSHNARQFRSDLTHRTPSPPGLRCWLQLPDTASDQVRSYRAFCIPRRACR